MKTDPEATVIDSDSSLRPAQFVAHKYGKGIDQANAENLIPVIEVFRTVEGEGMHVGTPRVLARVSGCQVGCSWCDTKHSWAVGNYDRMTVEAFRDLILETADGKVQQVSITGGEPMHYPQQLLKLVPMLRTRRMNVSLETSGLIMNDAVFSLFDFISMDIKSPSSKVPVAPALMLAYKDLWNWHPRVQFKVVIVDRADLEWVETHLSWLYTSNPVVRAPLILTPGVRNTQKAQESKRLSEHLFDVVQMIVDWNQRHNIRVIAQQHQLLVYR